MGERSPGEPDAGKRGAGIAPPDRPERRASSGGPQRRRPRQPPQSERSTEPLRRAGRQEIRSARAPPQERGVDEGAGMSGRAGERAERAGPLRGGEGLGQCSASGRAASRGLGRMTMPLASRGRHSLVRGGGALRLRLARAGIAMAGSAFRLKTQVSGCLGSAQRLFPILCGGGGGGTEPSSRAGCHGGERRGPNAGAAMEGSVPAVKREFQDFDLDRVLTLSSSVPLSVE